MNNYGLFAICLGAIRGFVRIFMRIAAGPVENGDADKKAERIVALHTRAPARIGRAAFLRRNEGRA
jgi:hypothetical protein